MAITNSKTPEELREQELEDREYVESVRDKQHAQEKTIKKLELKSNQLKYKLHSRHEAVRDVLVAVFRSPAWVIAVICITIITLAKKPVPECLSNFMKVSDDGS